MTSVCVGVGEWIEGRKLIRVVLGEEVKIWTKGGGVGVVLVGWSLGENGCDVVLFLGGRWVVVRFKVSWSFNVFLVVD